MLYLPLVSPPWMGWTETWSRWQNNKLVSGAGQKLKVTSDSTVSQSEHKLVWRSDLYGNFGGLCRQCVNIYHIWCPGMLNPILIEAFFVLYWRTWFSISHQVWLRLTYMEWIVFQSKHKLIWLVCGWSHQYCTFYSRVCLIFKALAIITVLRCDLLARPGTRADPPST